MLTYFHKFTEIITFLCLIWRHTYISACDGTRYVKIVFQNKLVMVVPKQDINLIIRFLKSKIMMLQTIKAKKSVLAWSWYLTTHCNHSQTAPERSCFVTKSCTQTEAIIFMLKHPLYVMLRVSPLCIVEGNDVVAVVWTTGQCSLPTCTSEKCMPQHISEEAFVTHSWMEMAWNHNTALNSDWTGRLCDPKWTHIQEEVDKLMDKYLLRIFSIFLVVHQYQYDTYYFNGTEKNAVQHNYKKKLFNFIDFLHVLIWLGYHKACKIYKRGLVV